jgi:hypothetical protein
MNIRFRRRALVLAFAVAGCLASVASSSAGVANPGAFTVHVTGGSIQIGFLGEQSLPASGWQLSGQIDANGGVTVPGSGVQFSQLPFDTTQVVSGVSVHVFGMATLASTGFSGSLDPASGSASLAGGLFATVSLTATAAGAQIYSGVCNLGSSTSPIAVALSTNPPGVPYSQSTGALTLASSFQAPSLDGCNPAIDPTYQLLLSVFAGSGHIALSGVTDPVLLADNAGQANQQTVTADVGASVLSVSVPSSISFPTLYPGQTSYPVSAPVTVISSDGFGYQVAVGRTAFSGGDIPLSLIVSLPSDPGMVRDVSGPTAIPIAVSDTDALVFGHRSSSITSLDGDVWPTALVLGPVPNVQPGQHTATLTYTVIGF